MSIALCNICCRTRPSREVAACRCAVSITLTAARDERATGAVAWHCVTGADLTIR